MPERIIARRRIPIHIIVFLAPATIVYTLFLVFPLIDSLRLSFFVPVETGGTTFGGFQNHITLLTDEIWSERFFNALWNNLIFFLIHMFVQNPVALVLAALLSIPKVRGKAIYQTTIFLPTMLSFVIVGFVWQLVLSPLWGVSESFLGLLGLGHLFAPWLGLESSALLTISLISVWQFVGLPMLLIYAALINIPESLIEAAKVDGAGEFSAFLRVKLPLLLPTLAIVSILTFVGNFNAFDLIFTAQGGLGAPNFATDILGTFFFRTFFGFQLAPPNPTMGATIAAMMFLIILSVVLIYMFVIQRRLLRFEL